MAGWDAMSEIFVPPHLCSEHATMRLMAGLCSAMCWKGGACLCIAGLITMSSFGFPQISSSSLMECLEMQNAQNPWRWSYSDILSCTARRTPRLISFLLFQKMISWTFRSLSCPTSKTTFQHEYGGWGIGSHVLCAMKRRFCCVRHCPAHRCYGLLFERERLVYHGVSVSDQEP